MPSVAAERDAMALIVAARAVNFPHLWRQLRARGWTAKKPTGLATEWTYIRPAIFSSEPTAFVGDQAVVMYALQNGLLDESDEDEAVTDEVVRASQIDTSVALSQATIDNLFDPPAPSQDVELSQSAVAHAFDVSQSVLECSMLEQEPAPEPATEVTLATQRRSRRVVKPAAVSDDRTEQPGRPRRSPRVPLRPTAPSHEESDADEADEAGEEESEAGEGDDADEEESEAEVDADDAESRAVPSGRGVRPIKEDVNYLSDNEDEGDYESLSSGDSDGVGFDDNDDDEIVRGGESDEEIEDDHAPLLDEAFLRQLSGFRADDELSKADLMKRQDALRKMPWGPVMTAFERDVTAFPGLNEDVKAQPVREVRRIADNPLQTFFFFMPKSLWIVIADETNRYNSQQVNARAQAMRARQRQDGRRTPDDLKALRRRLRAKEAYGTHEILHVLGLLIGHMLAPDKRRFSNHWSMTDDGTTPAGVFGRFMARARCTDILRDLHFVDNLAPRSRDKLSKLRIVSDRLQGRFLMAWTLPAVFSFDEGVLPATSRRNTTRMFMPDKPHRYGSKLFMTCDSRTAYCHRFEFYVGKRDAGDVSESFDNKTGAAAVLRNLKVVLGGGDGAPPRLAHHLVVVDRFYSSIPLAVELLTMKVYVVGTIQTNRIGFPKTVHEKRGTRPATIPRGTFAYTRSLQVPSLVALHWWDRKPVHYLATGAVLTEASIRRNVKGVGPTTVPSPQVVNDYQRWMGGVDVHDQLRLQKYSIQTSIRLRKYYKSLFLGLVDLALVNAYITHKEARKMDGVRPMERGVWYGTLRQQLLKLTALDFVGESDTPVLGSKAARRRGRIATHILEQGEDWIVVSGVQKRRQRACKVCALLRGDRKKSFQTTFYCEKCSQDRAKCYLCPKARHEVQGVMKTCFQIWHEDYDCGNKIPTTLGKRVVLRRPKAPEAGQRKKTRRELVLLDGADAEADEARADDGEVIDV